MIFTRTLTLTASTAVFLSVTSACVGLLNPAGAKLAEAEAHIEAGRFDDAVASLADLATAYPDSPEAALVPTRHARARVDQASALLAAGDVLGAGAAMDGASLGGLPPEDVLAIASETDEHLEYAVRFFYGSRAEYGDEVLMSLIRIHQDMKEADVDVLAVKAAIAATVTANVRESSAFSSCQAASRVDASIGDLSSFYDQVKDASGPCNVVLSAAELVDDGALQAELLRIGEEGEADVWVWTRRAEEEVVAREAELEAIAATFEVIDEAQRRIEDRYRPDIAAGSQRALAAAVRETTRNDQRRRAPAERCREMRGEIDAAPWPEDLKVRALDARKAVCP